MKKIQKWSWGVIILCILLFIFISSLPETKKEEAKRVRVAEELEDITAYPNDEYIQISKINEDGGIYQVWVRLKFVPDDYQQVQTWTDAVCSEAKQILVKNGISESISVWATYGTGSDEVKLYGNTYYSALLGTTEFKPYKK